MKMWTIKKWVYRKSKQKSRKHQQKKIKNIKGLFLGEWKLMFE
jgi:hypothetical protein